MWISNLLTLSGLMLLACDNLGWVFDFSNDGFLTILAIFLAVICFLESVRSWLLFWDICGLGVQASSPTIAKPFQLIWYLNSYMSWLQKRFYKKWNRQNTRLKSPLYTTIVPWELDVRAPSTTSTDGTGGFSFFWAHRASVSLEVISLALAWKFRNMIRIRPLRNWKDVSDLWIERSHKKVLPLLYRLKKSSTFCFFTPIRINFF